MHLSNLVVYDLLKGTRELDRRFFKFHFIFMFPKKTIQTLSQDVIINSFLLPESKGFFCSIITICLEGRNCSWLMTSLITTCRRFQLSTDAKKVQVQAPSSVLFYLWMWQECPNGSSFTRKIVKFPQKLPFSIKPCFAGLETWLTMQVTSPLILLHWLD